MLNPNQPGLCDISSQSHKPNWTKTNRKRNTRTTKAEQRRFQRSHNEMDQTHHNFQASRHSDAMTDTVKQSNFAREHLPPEASTREGGGEL